MGSLPIGRVHLSWGFSPLLHMPLSSKWSVTGALQASNAGSSPASGTIHINTTGASASNRRTYNTPKIATVRVELEKRLIATT